MELNSIQQFYKPVDICVPLSVEQQMMVFDSNLFGTTLQQNIDERLLDLDMTLRAADFSDLPMVREFNDRYFPRLEGNELRSYDYYQLIQFGKILILSQQQETIGVVFEIGLDTPERTGYVRRLLVTPKYRGTKASNILADAIILWAYNRGSRVLRSVIALQNKVSLFFLLNKIGFMISEINPKIEGLTRYYNAFLPASPIGIMGNKVDRFKLDNYLADLKLGDDYLLLPMNDTDRIESLLNHKEHILVSLRVNSKRSYEFVALPKNRLVYM